MDLEQLIFTNCVTTKGQPSLSSSQEMDLFLVALLPFLGTVLAPEKTTQMAFFSPSLTLTTSLPPNTLAIQSELMWYGVTNLLDQVSVVGVTWKLHPILIKITTLIFISHVPSLIQLGREKCSRSVLTDVSNTCKERVKLLNLLPNTKGLLTKPNDQVKHHNKLQHFLP